ncbi:MAG TPA: hypothetical protein VMM13_09990, partial [Euzebya sp.]|nr:hypothetical protein [Euzebya sp.]
ALSLVSLLSYSGFLLGPATIGALADLTSLRWALLLPAALVLLAMLVATRIRLDVSAGAVPGGDPAAGQGEPSARAGL